MAYKPLDEKQVKSVANLLFSLKTEGVSANVKPVYVAVGGQAGAGKTEAINLVEKELKNSGGALYLNTDDVREALPNLKKDTKLEESHPDAGKVVDHMRELAMQKKINVIEEGTFKDAAWTSKLVNDNKTQGYNNELIGVATPPELSLSSVYRRFEAEIQKNVDRPRLVPEAVHNNSVHGFRETVQKNENQFDRVRIINRKGESLFDSTDKSNTKTAHETLLEKQKPTDQQLINTLKTWETAKELGEKRNAPSHYLEAIDKHMTEIKDQQKERIHNYSMESVPKNLEILKSDDRFKNHTQDELLKVSYFRGFHEKSKEFEGAPSNFKAFDNAMSDREIVKNHLPDVEGLEKYKTKERTNSKDDGMSL